jgi:hypothetical protein
LILVGIGFGLNPSTTASVGIKTVKKPVILEIMFNRFTELHGYLSVYVSMAKLANMSQKYSYSCRLFWYKKVRSGPTMIRIQEAKRQWIWVALNPEYGTY